MLRPARVGIVGLALALTGAWGCGQRPGDDPESIPIVADGNAERGEALIHEFGCGSCHTIPGVRGADGLVGPPLTHFAHRGFIAGELPNDPKNLIRWIMDPPSVEPGTAMPVLGVREQEARDIAAYLYTLR